MTRSFDHLDVGDVVGDFRLLEPLGDLDGLRQRSFLAERLDDGRRAALTLHHPSDVAETARIADLLGNARHYGRLGSGDGLLPDTGGGVDDGVVWISNGWLPGARTLSALAATGCLWTNHELQVIGVALGRALITAEAAGVVFGGLGSTDVLYDPTSGKAWIATLPCSPIAPTTPVGWARLLRDVTCQPPELLEGAPPSPATDRYALCALLFTLAAGRTPYGPRPDVAAGCNAVLNDAAPSLADDLPLSEELRRVILRGLAKEPSERFADAPTLVVALERCAVDDRFVADSDRLRDVAVQHFPLPAARPLSLVARGLESSHEIRTIQSVAAGLVTIVGALAAGELARHGLRPAPDLRALARPAMGHWLQVAREARRRLSGRTVAFPEWLALFGEADNTPDTGDAALSRLVGWRNVEGHAHVVEDAATWQSLREGRAALDAALGPLAFLGRMQLVWIDTLVHQGGRFEVEGLLLEGARPTPFKAVVDAPPECRVVLAASPDLTRSVSLDPWVRVFDCPECGERDVWVWLHGVDGGGEYRSFHLGHTAVQPVDPATRRRRSA